VHIDGAPEAGLGLAEFHKIELMRPRIIENRRPYEQVCSLA
jgi:hypothetical protein